MKRGRNLDRLTCHPELFWNWNAMSSFPRECYRCIGTYTRPFVYHWCMHVAFSSIGSLKIIIEFAYLKVHALDK